MFALDVYSLFSLLHSVVWMDICSDKIAERRISCFACQNGFLKLVVANENGTSHDLFINMPVSDMF
jgi:hypothetical protein